MAKFKQDMPPPGGYAPVVYGRTPAKTWGSGFKASIFVVVTTVGYLISRHTRDILNIEKIEMRCSKLAIRPMLEAERDRAVLKQLKKNRDEEERIMKDVPGWEIGKWNHYPVYFTVGPDEYFKPFHGEYYAHTEKNAFRNVLRLRNYI